VTDSLGNPTVKDYTITLDTASPVLSVDSLYDTDTSNASYTDGGATLTFTATDAGVGGTLNYSIAGNITGSPVTGTLASGGSKSQAVTVGGAGPFTLTVTDSLGNPTAKDYTITLDTDKPTISVGSQYDAVANTLSATITETGSGVTIVRWTDDLGTHDIAPNGSPVTGTDAALVAVFTVSGNSFSYVLVDGAGNISAPSGTLTKSGTVYSGFTFRGFFTDLFTPAPKPKDPAPKAPSGGGSPANRRIPPRFLSSEPAGTAGDRGPTGTAAVERETPTAPPAIYPAGIPRIGYASRSGGSPARLSYGTVSGEASGTAVPAGKPESDDPGREPLGSGPLKPAIRAKPRVDTFDAAPEDAGKNEGSSPSPEGYAPDVDVSDSADAGRETNGGPVLYAVNTGGSGYAVDLPVRERPRPERRDRHGGLYDLRLIALPAGKAGGGNKEETADGPEDDSAGDAGNGDAGNGDDGGGIGLNGDALT
jgi:hypothetical protein